MNLYTLNLSNLSTYLHAFFVKTQEGYMSEICPWTYVGQTSHDEGRDTCLFHQVDSQNQTSFSLLQFELSVRLVQILIIF